MDKLLIIDGNSLAHRNYHAVKASPNGLIYSDSQVPVSISKAFLGSLKKLIREQTPTHICVCFDPGGKNWRHVLYPQYKGTRAKDENYENFCIDLRNLKLILAEQKITTVVIPGNEADDAIASLVSTLNKSDREITISSTDKDLLQLVNDDFSVKQVCSHKGITKEYTEARVFEEMGVRACQVADYKALCGDKSDNIPGVTGIGKISACNLLDDYGNVEAIASNVEYLKPSLQKKIEPEVDKMLLFKKLTELRAWLQIEVEFEQLSVDNIVAESAIAQELGIAV